MKNEKTPSELLAEHNNLLRKHLLEHVELTRRRADANERYLRLMKEEAKTISDNLVGNLDVFIELSKNIFSVAFTGFIALKVANPQWINTAQTTVNLTLIIMALTLVLLILFMWRRSTIISRAVSVSSSQSKATKTLLDGEVSCIDGILKMHTDLMTKDLEPKDESKT